MKKRHCKMENGKHEAQATRTLTTMTCSAHTHTHRHTKSGKESEGAERAGEGMLAKKNFSAVKTNLENLIKIAKLWQLIKFSRTRTTTQNGDQVESLKQATSQSTYHSPQCSYSALQYHPFAPPNHSRPTVPARRQV